MIIYIILALLIYLGFSSNLITGVIVTIISLGFLVWKNLPALYAMAGARSYNSDKDEAAISWYERAVDTGRADAKIYSAYILILMRTGRLKSAQSALNLAIANPKIATADKYILKCYRCLVYFKTGNGEEALSDAREIFECYKNTTVYGLLGYLMLATDESPDKTLDFCLEAYDYNSDDRDIVDNLVLAYYKLGRLDEAEDLAAKLREMSPSFVEAQYHSALIARARGKIEEAREFVKNIDSCLRTALTTVGEEEIEDFKKELKGL